VSGQFVDKIKSAIQKDIGRTIPIKANYISSIWGAYGQYINETNVGPLMDHFLQQLGRYMRYLYVRLTSLT